MKRGKKANGNKGAAAGPVETMVPRVLGQKVHGNKAAAVAPIETTVPRLPGQTVTVTIIGLPLGVL